MVDLSARPGIGHSADSTSAIHYRPSRRRTGVRVPHPISGAPMSRMKPGIELTSTASKRTLSDQTQLRSLVAAPVRLRDRIGAGGRCWSLVHRVPARGLRRGGRFSARGRRQLAQSVETEDDVSERKRFYAGSATRSLVRLLRLARTQEKAAAGLCRRREESWSHESGFASSRMSKERRSSLTVTPSEELLSGK
jgi:hypothetical protein